LKGLLKRRIQKAYFVFFACSFFKDRFLATEETGIKKLSDGTKELSYFKKTLKKLLFFPVIFSKPLIKPDFVSVSSTL
jgi:hypothetical protein